jgi:hypothetical protein
MARLHVENSLTQEPITDWMNAGMLMVQMMLESQKNKE